MIQQTAVCHVDGPMLVVAGPGSGKTTVITHRILHLIRQEHIPPDQILVITYTRAAAKEMRLRFERLLEEPCRGVSFGTLHAVFFTILRHAYGYRSDQILPENLHGRLIRELARKAGIGAAYEDPLYGQIASAISLVKNGLGDAGLQSPGGIGPEAFCAIYSGYQNYLAENRLIDFDDMQIYCRDLLTGRADIRAAWQRRYRYLLVDEFQDCSPIQYQLLKLLAAPEDNLFLVGDDDQSIYGFRGASPGLMQTFLKDYPQAAQVTLGTNYRSHPDIIEGAYLLVEHNLHRLSKKRARAAGDFQTNQQALACHSLQDQRAECQFMIGEIRKARRQGLAYADMAILTRTNAQLSYYHEFLEGEAIPCIFRDLVPDLYRHWVARDVLAYFRLAMGSRTSEDLLRIMNRPNRFLSRDLVPGEPVSFAEWCENYRDRDWMQDRIDLLEDDLDRISRLRPYGALIYLRKAVGYEDWLRDYAKSRSLQVEKLTEVLDELAERAKKYEDIPSWFAAIRAQQEALLVQAKKRDPGKQDGICLSTYHGAKGLEFALVILPDLCEGVAPYHKAATPEELEEERRMFYVAMTRAKTRLCLLCAEEIGNRKKEPSRFLREISPPTP